MLIEVVDNPKKHGTNIRWTHGTGYMGETLNVIIGCSKVSNGCKNCYAETLSMDPKMRKFGYTGLPWTAANAHLNVIPQPQRLEKMLHWTKPRMVFLNSMSDTFHELVTEEYLRQIYAHMAAVPQHIFQVLTKRPERMEYFLSKWMREDDFYDVYGNKVTFPLPNVWHGTTTENQKWADIRIPHLLNTPSVVRFLSCEPLLGPINLRQYLQTPITCEYCFATTETVPDDWETVFDTLICPDCVNRTSPYRLLHTGEYATTPDPRERLHWIIAGGESGIHLKTDKRRWMDLDWARQIRDDCVEFNVPFFFKQSSAIKSEQGKELDGKLWEQMPFGVSVNE